MRCWGDVELQCVYIFIYFVVCKIPVLWEWSSIASSDPVSEFSETDENSSVQNALCARAYTWLTFWYLFLKEIQIYTAARISFEFGTYVLHVRADLTHFYALLFNEKWILAWHFDTGVVNYGRRVSEVGYRLRGSVFAVTTRWRSVSHAFSRENWITADIYVRMIFGTFTNIWILTRVTPGISDCYTYS